SQSGVALRLPPHSKIAGAATEYRPAHGRLSNRPIRAPILIAGTSPLELGLYTPPHAHKLSNVPEILSETRRIGPYPTALANQVLLDSDLETAIERSQSYLLSLQKPEGYWVGELMTDST